MQDIEIEEIKEEEPVPSTSTTAPSTLRASVPKGKRKWILFDKPETSAQTSVVLPLVPLPGATAKTPIWHFFIA